MSSRRTQSMPPAAFDHHKLPKERGRCIAAICVSWKVFTCIFSHAMLVTLVVSYCLLGAMTFEYLESKNELEVKKGISALRGNFTDKIWKMTYEESDYLYEQNWTRNVAHMLQNFETEILNSMKLKGWDGNEEMNKMQWTYSGALFYSIIVITTIGYGHIAPKTYMGKICTIFYAILGIPLMLLCLSNIGDIMATSFRFLYWRVCCYVCTRQPKRNQKQRLRRQETLRHQASGSRSSGNKFNPNMRRSMRVSSQRTADSGFDQFSESGMQHAYSDTDLRYNNSGDPHTEWERDKNFNNKMAQNRNQRFSRNRNRESYRHTVERDRNVNRPNNRYPDDKFSSMGRSNSQRNRSQSIARETALPSRGDNMNTLPASYSRNKTKMQAHRAQSLDPRGRPDFKFDETPDKTPVLCNKYAIDDLDGSQMQINKNPRSQSMPRQGHSNSNRRGSFGDENNRFENEDSFSHPKHTRSHQRDRQHQQRHQNQLYPPDDEFIEMQPVVMKKAKRRERHAPPPPSPRIMSPMGFAVHRQARLQMYPDDDSQYGDDWDYNSSDLPSRIRPVPIWLCVFLVVSYIIAGAFLFSSWEGWSFLDSAYFCFITLTTIGFGDFVPAQGVIDQEVSIAFCSLYLLFGIALLAMSFNLVQEEVIANVKSVARQLGILKDEEVYY